MKLGIKMLDGDSTVNKLTYLNQVELSPGETGTIMFQLIDMVSGNRYMPEAGATMTAKMVSTNNNNVISKIPSKPFATDGSIWSFPMSAVDSQKAAGVNLEIVLTEGSNVKKVWAQSVIVMMPNSPFRA